MIENVYLLEISERLGLNFVLKEDIPTLPLDTFMGIGCLRETWNLRKFLQVRDPLTQSSSQDTTRFWDQNLLFEEELNLSYKCVRYTNAKRKTTLTKLPPQL